MFNLLEPQPDKRIPLENMFNDPWFKAMPSVDPGFDQEIMFPPSAAPLRNAIGSQEYGMDDHAPPPPPPPQQNTAGEGAAHGHVWSKHGRFSSAATIASPRGSVAKN